MIQVNIIEVCPECFSPYLAFNVVNENSGVTISNMRVITERASEPSSITCRECQDTVFDTAPALLVYYKHKLYVLALEEDGSYYRLVDVPYVVSSDGNLLFNIGIRVVSRFAANEIIEELIDIIYLFHDDNEVERAFNNLLMLAKEV